MQNEQSFDNKKFSSIVPSMNQIGGFEAKGKEILTPEEV